MFLGRLFLRAYVLGALVFDEVTCVYVALFGMSWLQGL